MVAEHMESPESLQTSAKGIREYFPWLSPRGIHLQHAVEGRIIFLTFPVRVVFDLTREIIATLAVK